MSDNVLRSYLVGLGFKVDQPGLKKFQTSLSDVAKQVRNLGLTMAGAVTGVVAGTTVIASQMEKLYYAGQRTGVTVAALMKFRYAAQQIGLTADQAQGALEGFARELRLNPGKSALLNALGVQGKDAEQKLWDFIRVSKDMQPYVAAAYASQFGLDPDSLLMMQQGYDKHVALEAKYAAQLKQWGLSKEDGKGSVAFMNQMRDLRTTFDLLAISIETKLAPRLGPLIDKFTQWANSHADEIAKAIGDAIEGMAKWLASVNWKEVSSTLDAIVSALGGFKGLLIAIAAISLAGPIAAIATLALTVGKLAGAGGGLIGRLLGIGGGTVAPTAGSAVNTVAKTVARGVLGRAAGAAGLLLHSQDAGAGEDEAVAKMHAKEDGARSLFGSLESRYGLPPGLLDSDWAAESGRGKNMLSPVGAMGHFQFMPATAREFGLKNPNDLVESAGAAARKFAGLFKRYGGDQSKAIGAYNYGEGNMDKVIAKYGADWMAHLPKETSDYIAKVSGGMGGYEPGNNPTTAGVNIAQQTTITVNGATEPAAVANAVASKQRGVNADLTRNLAPVLM